MYKKSGSLIIFIQLFKRVSMLTEGGGEGVSNDLLYLIHALFNVMQYSYILSFNEKLIVSVLNKLLCVVFTTLLYIVLVCKTFKYHSLFTALNQVHPHV